MAPGQDEDLISTGDKPLNHGQEVGELGQFLKAFSDRQVSGTNEKPIWVSKEALWDREDTVVRRVGRSAIQACLQSCADKLSDVSYLRVHSRRRCADALQD